MDWDRYSYVRNNPLRYNDPTGHRLDENGDTGGIPHADPDKLQEAIDDLDDAPIIVRVVFDGVIIPIRIYNGTINGFEGSDWDLALSLLPLLGMLDDVLDLSKYGDEAVGLIIKEYLGQAIKNTSGSYAVLGKMDNVLEAVKTTRKTALHLNLPPDKYDEFVKTYGADAWWKYVNEPFIDIIGENGIPVQLTETITKEMIDTLPGTFGDEVRHLVKKYHYELHGNRLLPPAP